MPAHDGWGPSCLTGWRKRKADAGLKKILLFVYGLYVACRGVFLSRAVQSKIVKEVLRLNLNSGRAGDAIALPDPFGRGLPERVVELLYARKTYREGMKVLDVGCANSMPCHLRFLDSLKKPRSIVGLDIAEPPRRIARRYDGFVRRSIKDTGFADGTFDLVWCISSLEHFGMDVSRYQAGIPEEENLAGLALREMFRIVKNAGRILITVPFGAFENHGWLINYDERRLAELLRPFRDAASILTAFYRHTYGKGWQGVDPRRLESIGYYDQANRGAAGLACIVMEKAERAGRR